MGSTYLELTNRVLRRLNEVEIGASDFAGVRGVQAAAKDAVLDAVREINTQKFEWPFNATTGSQTLTAGTNLYSWPADLRIPDWKSFYIYKDGTISTENVHLPIMTKDEWYAWSRDNDLNNSTTGIRRPERVFEAPAGGFGVTPNPDAAYVVKWTYWIKTITLSADSDTCTIPTEYDHVITDCAMKHLYLFFDNDERAAKASSDFEKGLKEMTYILIPKDPYMYNNMMNVGGGARNRAWPTNGYFSV